MHVLGSMARDATIHHGSAATAPTPGNLIAEHAFLRKLLDGIDDAARQVLSKDPSVAPVLFALLHELQTVLGRHLVQETAVLHPVIAADTHSAALDEKLRAVHDREYRLLAALGRWLARDLDAPTLARHGAAFCEAIRLGLDVEERGVFRELPRPQGET